MFDKLFRFPIIMADGDQEEKKAKRSLDLGLEENADVDMVRGFAECPYYDFISITDRWLPTEESLQKALDGEFEACFVVFGASGSFVVPWTREKFKKEMQKFIDGLPEEPGRQVIMMEPQDFARLIKNKDEDEEEK